MTTAHPPSTLLWMKSVPLASDVQSLQYWKPVSTRDERHWVWDLDPGVYVSDSRHGDWCSGLWLGQGWLSI